MQPPQIEADAPWKQRFRVPMTFVQPARANPTRGLVSSNRSGVFQLYAWDVDTGALTQLTDIPTGKPGGVIAPDGRFVYYFQDESGNELGHWVRVPFSGGPPEDMTPDLPPYASWNYSVARAGNRAGLTTADQDGFHIFVMDHEAGGTLHNRRKLYHSAKLASGPQFSTDGALALVETAERAEKPQFSLLVFDAASGERLGELWDGPDTSISSRGFSPVAGDHRVLAVSDRSGVKRPLVWNARTGERHDLDLGELEGEAVAWEWAPDAGSVILCHEWRAVQRLYRYDLERHTLQRLDHPGGTFWSCSFTSDDEILVHWTDSTHPPQAICLDAQTGTLKRTVFGVDDVPPSRPWRSVSFPSADGAIIQGWLALPDGEGPFPTILETHGGPTAATLDGWDAGSQMWLDHGFAFLTINYHGSTTFGKAFEESIYGDLGRLEVQDMAAAREWLVREGIAQPDAILLTGWSYGGYLTLMGLGVRPELWAGGMAGIAIADWTIQYEDTAPTLRGYQEAIFGGSPAEKPEVYARSSPISYAEHVRAPVLVIQGSNDTRCPARPMHMYEAKLKALGKQIEVEWFEAGHGSYETEKQIQHHELMLRFAYRVLG
jgi:dipeptidyl aminopeptidase/acylaminoacyl peptidase